MQSHENHDFSIGEAFERSVLWPMKFEVFFFWKRNGEDIPKIHVQSHGNDYFLLGRHLQDLRVGLCKSGVFIRVEWGRNSLFFHLGLRSTADWPADVMFSCHVNGPRTSAGIILKRPLKSSCACPFSHYHGLITNN